MRTRTITLEGVSGGRAEAELVERHADGGLTVRLPDGQSAMIAAGAIAGHGEDGYRLAVSLAELGIGPEAGGGEHTVRVPLVEEEAVVEKRRLPTAEVRLDKRVETRREEIEETLAREEYDVSRVPVNRFVDAPETIRESGDEIVVPLHEEVLVVEKRLLLREELHLTKRTEQRRETRNVELRRERADVERREPQE